MRILVLMAIGIATASLVYAQDAPPAPPRAAQPVAEAIIFLFDLLPSDEPLLTVAPAGAVDALRVLAVMNGRDERLIEAFVGSREHAALVGALGTDRAQQFLDQVMRGREIEALIQEFVPAHQRDEARLRVIQAMEESTVRPEASSGRRSAGPDAAPAARAAEPRVSPAGSAS